jgi:hypothetical protein
MIFYSSSALSGGYVFFVLCIRSLSRAFCASVTDSPGGRVDEGGSAGDANYAIRLSD